jgi:FdrA protein
VSWHVRVVSNRYADSVRLMAVARELRERGEVRACELAMGTPANLEALDRLGVAAEAAPGDLVIAVDAEGGAAEEALAEAERSLSAPPSEASDGRAEPPRPRSLAAATRELSAANVAMISVPGDYAVLEAHRALSAGMHVFLFSDHVDVERELELKRRGAELGLLVMGPECGTAMVAGVGLGFSNVVRPGPVGIVAAAGTGAQETACLLDAAGGGVSHIVGVGGRDLSREVGGLMLREGVQLLAADGATETLLLVSKPPAPEVVDELADAMPDGMRVVAAFVGWEGGEAPFEVHPTLEEGALACLGGAAPAPAELEAAVDRARSRTAGRALVGLYSGGSLAHEAATILEPELGPLGGNVGGHAGDGAGRRPGNGTSREPGDGAGHAVFDLGDGAYTRGRPHPMLDLDVRFRMLEEAAADPGVGCVLLDVVLGRCAHRDPAGELAPAVERATADGVVVARVCGTPDDPQDATRQEATLRAAGALVAPSNACAARLALRAVR